jgi:hypothetical protein
MSAKAPLSVLRATPVCQGSAKVTDATRRPAAVVCRALRKWVDTAEDGKHALLHARCEARAGRLAAAVKALDKAATAAAEVVNKPVSHCLHCQIPPQMAPLDSLRLLAMSAHAPFCKCFVVSFPVWGVVPLGCRSSARM